MSLSIICPSCGAALRAPEGRRPEVVRCPRCKGPVSLRAVRWGSRTVLPTARSSECQPSTAGPPPTRRASGLSAWWLVAPALAMIAAAGAAVFVLVAVVYLSPKGPSPAAQSVAPPPPPPAEFNSSDVHETLRWLEDQVKDTPPESGNEIRDKEVTDGVKGRMKWLEGKQVSWTFEVEEIRESAIRLRPARRERPHKVPIVVDVLLSRPGGEGFGEISFRGFLGKAGNNEYPFAAGEDKHWAAALNPGDPLTVTGEVSWVLFFNQRKYSPACTFTFSLRNATATGRPTAGGR